MLRTLWHSVGRTLSQSSAHGSSINDGLNWAEIAFGLLVGTSLFSTHTNLASCGEQSWARLALLLTWGHTQVSWLTLRSHSWVVTFPPGIVCSGFLWLCSPGSTPLLPAHSQLQPLCSAPAPGWALVLFQNPGLLPLGHKGGWHCNLISISVSYFRLCWLLQSRCITFLPNTNECIRIQQNWLFSSQSPFLFIKLPFDQPGRLEVSGLSLFPPSPANF